MVGTAVGGRGVDPEWQSRRPRTTNVFSASQSNLIGSGVLAGGAVGRSMDPVDQGCVSGTLEHTPTKRTVAWKNPGTNSSYWVTPTDTY